MHARTHTHTHTHTHTQVPQRQPKYQYIPNDYLTCTVITALLCGLFSPLTLMFTIPAYLFARKVSKTTQYVTSVLPMYLLLNFYLKLFCIKLASSTNKKQIQLYTLWPFLLLSLCCPSPPLVLHSVSVHPIESSVNEDW